MYYLDKKVCDNWIKVILQLGSQFFIIKKNFDKIPL